VTIQAHVPDASHVRPLFRGTIRLDSSPGAGTTVTLTLVQADAAEQAC
jgi:signal transduction histidine kinase